MMMRLQYIKIKFNISLNNIKKITNSLINKNLAEIKNIIEDIYLTKNRLNELKINIINKLTNVKKKISMNNFIYLLNYITAYKFNYIILPGCALFTGLYVLGGVINLTYNIIVLTEVPGVYNAFPEVIEDILSIPIDFDPVYSFTPRNVRLIEYIFSLDPNIGIGLPYSSSPEDYLDPIPIPGIATLAHFIYQEIIAPPTIYPACALDVVMNKNIETLLPNNYLAVEKTKHLYNSLMFRSMHHPVEFRELVYKYMKYLLRHDIACMAELSAQGVFTNQDLILLFNDHSNEIVHARLLLLHMILTNAQPFTTPIFLGIYKHVLLDPNLIDPLKLDIYVLIRDNIALLQETKTFFVDIWTIYPHGGNGTSFNFPLNRSFSSMPWVYTPIQNCIPMGVIANQPLVSLEHDIYIAYEDIANYENSSIKNYIRLPHTLTLSKR